MPYSIIAAILTVVLCMSAVCAGCRKNGSGDENVIPDDYQPTADENPFLADTGYARAEVSLDGALDEEQWQGLAEVAFSEKVSAVVKGFYGENGIYIGAVISDTDLWGGSDKVYDNTSFELYLDTTGEGGETPGSNHIQLFIDVNEKSMVRRGSGGQWVDTDLIKSYAVALDGTLNDSEADQGYSVEMFIPYSQLGGESAVDYGIAFGAVGCSGGIRESWCGITGVDVQSPDTYYRFYRDNNAIEAPRKENKATIMLDGKADDAIWTDRKLYAFGDGGRGAVSQYFASEGVYFFFEMKDDKVYAEGKASYLNDSVELYLDTAQNGGKTPQTDDVQIRVDVAGNIEFLRGNGTEWAPARDNTFAGIRVVGGSLNGAASGYNIEIFVPWSDLGLPAAPEAMNVSFGSVDWDGVKNADGSRKISWSGIGSDPQNPDNYVKMTAGSIEGSGVIGDGAGSTGSGSTAGSVQAPVSEVTLDGILNDSLWNSANLFLYSGGSVKVQWVWTDRGCYLGFDVTDDYVQTNGMKPFENSSVEVYLDYEANGGSPDEKDRTILVDAAGNMLFRKGVDGAYLDFATSAIQSGVRRTDSGYTAELYVPWSEFGGSRPEKMGVAFGQVALTWGEEGTHWYSDGLCADPQNPSLYSSFTAGSIGN